MSFRLQGEEVRAISKIGRSAKTGRFTTIKKAESRPSTHIVETIYPHGKK